ncbi:Clavaminate synthase-like protein [Trametes coccinea BRFM310]|uniref:Clavaminate synthase-like protein n=1 Tax=Trametes coccinea (strain BRFM310) TaxID=1353009 RepID=A0A1Y2IU46_TRAC3|nr:Clavaminate synthase-like protein [Trametes coccinea BRFM310]
MQEYRREALRWLAEEYHDLNGTQYDVLEDFPTPLEFSRMVHISRPILMRGSAIPSLSDAAAWSKPWLADKMGDRDISVAVTPNGRADAVTRGPDNKLYFAEPLTQKMSVQALLRSLSSDGPPAADASQDARTSQAEVHYLQSQNGNLFSNRYYELRGDSEDPSEFEPLREYIPSEISWCSDALDRNPDAVNLWIGDEKSVTSIHSDPYENIYTVLRGSKQFTLLPPTEGWCLKERRYPHATYVRSPVTSQLELVPSPAETPLVRWSSVTDPTDPTALPAEAHPIHITVNAGETLYLPAGWWHYVCQRGFTVAVNYWYDMEGRGMSWVWLNFLRDTEEPPLGNGEDEPEGGEKE